MFCEDILRVIQTFLDSDGVFSATKKKAIHTAKGIFVKVRLSVVCFLFHVNLNRLHDIITKVFIFHWRQNMLLTTIQVFLVGISIYDCVGRKNSSPTWWPHDRLTCQVSILCPNNSVTIAPAGQPCINSYKSCLDIWNILFLEPILLPCYINFKKIVCVFPF